MNTSPESLLDRLLGAAVMLVAVAVLLSWAWTLLRPLVPVVVVGLVVFGFFRWQSRR